MSDYLTDFVQESNEQITELNNALLTLEQAPDDDDAMENIFRIAHTLKGNCGAMGLEPASDLAHAIEDVLDAVRSGDLDATSDLMDVIFDAVDELETMFEEVEASGEIDADPSETIQALRSRLDEPRRVPSTDPPTDDEIRRLVSQFDPPAEDEHDAYLARLAITPDESVNNGILVVKALIDAFELLGTDPPRESVEDETYGGSFDAVFGSAVGEAAIESGLKPVDEVAAFELVNVTEAFEAAEVDADAAKHAEADRADPGDGLSTDDAQDLDVDELLDEFDEFDNLDEKVEEFDDDDLAPFEDMGDAGSFDDLFDDEERDDGPIESDAAIEAADATDEAAGSAPDDADDEVDDASAVFQELKNEVEMVGFDELQDELEELEFEEFDDEEEIGMDELLGDDVEDGSFLDRNAVETDADALFEVDDADESVPEADGADATDDAVVADDAAVAEDVPPADDADESGVEAGKIDESIAEAGDADESTAEADGADGSTVKTEADEPIETAADLDDGDDDLDVEPEPTDAGVGVEADGDAETESDAGTAVEFDESIDQDADSIADEPADAAAIDEDEPSSSDVDGEDETVTADLEADRERPDEPVTDTESVTPEASETASIESDAGGDLDPDTDEASAEADDIARRDSFTLDDTEATDSFNDVFGDETFEDEAFDDDSFDDDSFEDETFADDAFDDDSFGDEAFADETFEDGSFDDETFDDDSFEEDAFADEAFGDETFDEDAFDDEAIATAAAEFDAAGDGDSADASFGDERADDGSDGDEDGVVRIVDEPEIEIPDIIVPETSERPDAEQQADEVQSVRVDVEQIDSLLTLVEGLVTSRVRLRHAVDSGEDLQTIASELDDLEDLTTELQETVTDVRLVPLNTVTNRLPRVVRDIARDQDKEIEFEMTGGEVELDRSILDRIGDPLIHLVRNAVDHGVELPEAREAADKPREGTVAVTADRSRDRVRITVSDDGGGLDPERLRNEAVEADVLDEVEAAELADEDTYDLIFHPGLSTADEVTDVSGRGVGMDVVKRTIEDLEGTVEIESEPGAGTTVTMTLPVTVAIDDILFLECGGEEFGVPTKAVDDIGAATTVETVDGSTVFRDEDGEYPVIHLDEALETPAPGANGDGMIVRIRDEVRPVVLHCDEVYGQQEVVVKPFEGFMSDIPGLSGATVRGRGEVVNILDVTTL
ncbi:ATP-binding protein [Halosolutus gelatinilyticus]|uniref:ATP-binding protein n=1 Tax=Halosolutus gelatinilyticus TaxID=2931975 RepID=UPI001FF3DCA9|nr:ATP-binding protein [Halosolutus gelatinilyticus]